VRLTQRLADQRRAQATEEDFLAVQDPSWAELKRCRERDECREKLHQLNLLK
jgi:thymidylate synthase (FAD)